MRMRNPKNKDELINNCKYLIEDTIEFPTENPLYVEIGMGKGQFIINQALANPQINFIGVEKYTSVAALAIKKINEHELDNLKILIGDIADYEEMFNKKIDKIFLNFSDPWPKERHAKRRLTHERLLALYDQLFKRNAHIVLKTDNSNFFEFSLNSLKDYGYEIIAISYDMEHEDRPNIKTEYEEKFLQKGEKIKYLEAVKKNLQG